MSETQVPDLTDRRTRLKYKMTEAREELVKVLRSLTLEQLALPTRNEGWNVGQVAAHIAGAEGSMEIIARRIQEQDPQQREITLGLDLTRYNNSMIKRRADKTIEELIAELEASRARVFELLDSCTDEQLDYSGLHPAFGETTLYGVLVIIYRHERDHTADIRQALADASTGAN